MLKNLIVNVKKWQDPLGSAEMFSLEFKAIEYFYFRKLRVKRFSNVSWIYIEILNTRESNFEATTWSHGGTYHCRFNFDFAEYIISSDLQKKHLQHKLIQFGLNKILGEYPAYSSLINLINDEVIEQNYKLEILYDENIVAGKTVSLFVDMELYSFTYYIRFATSENGHSIELFKSEVGSILVSLLFSKKKIDGSNLFYGSLVKRLFHIDCDSEKIYYLEPEFLEEYSLK